MEDEMEDEVLDGEEVALVEAEAEMTIGGQAQAMITGEVEGMR